MSESDPFESPKLLLDRAKEHFEEFKAKSAKLIADYDCVPAGEVNRQGTQKRMYFQFERPKLGPLRTIASDIVNNLRNALDQAVVAASRELGATRTKAAYFPFSKTAGDLPAQIKYRCKDVPAELASYLCSFQPYLGGDDLLWSLGRMAGPNKHQVLLALQPDIGSFLVENERGVGLMQRPKNTDSSRGMHVRNATWDGSKYQLTVGTLFEGANYNANFYFPFFVALGPVDVVGGKGAARIFRELLSKVESIVAAIEAETARLKT